LFCGAVRVKFWRTGAFWGFWDAVVYCRNITNSVEICHTLAHFCGFADGGGGGGEDSDRMAVWMNVVQ